jgi:Ca2+-binding EF-hand superfamily protein
MSIVARKLSKDGIPGPKGFEVALSRTITAHSVNLLKTIQRLDEDDDGYLSKNDLQNSLRDYFGLSLDDEQIQTIFRRARMSESSEGKEVETRNDNEKGGAADDLLSFTMFQKYVFSTSSDSSHPSSRMFTSNASVTASSIDTNKGNNKDKRSVIAKTKHLKSIVLKAIEQSVPMGNFGRVASSIFLQMDTHRDNQITRAEFKSWLEDKHGIHLTDAEMKLVFGKWVKNEGLSLQEFSYFLECFLSGYCKNEDVGDDQFLVTQRKQKELNHDQSDDEKTDKELIWALLNYFRGINKSHAQAFYTLDKYGSKTLSAVEVSIGFKRAGLNVSPDRSWALLRKFASANGKVGLTSYVRMMTSVSTEDNVE